MSKTYRAAIIGVGAIAQMHARAMGDLANVELVAGCCRTAGKGKAFAEQFGGKWYGDYEAMLDEQRPDFVTIATPSGAHLEPAAASFGRVVAVLCEKPLEINLQRADAMIRAADEAGVVLGGIFPQRYNPVVVAMHEAAAAGRFGDLAAVSSYVPWWRDDEYYAPGRWQGTQKLDGGGAMINQSIHGVDAVQWLAAAAGGDAAADNPVKRVCAFTARRGHDTATIEVEDTAVAVLEFRSGALGQLLAATSMFPGSLKRIQIAGRNGTAEVLEDQLITWQFRDPTDGDEAIRKRFNPQTAGGGGASDPMAIDYSHHTRNIADFVDALDAGRPFMLHGGEARKAVAIIEAIYESASAGGAVQVR